MSHSHRFILLLSIPGYRFSETIYEGERTSIDRGIRLSDSLPVIGKSLRARTPEPREVARIRREFEIASNTRIPGIVKAIGLYPNRSGLVLVLEDFGGQSLARLPNQGVGNISDFLNIAIRVSEVLLQVHKEKIIHKDIKPANILLNAGTGEIRLIDFGISSTLTRENPVLQTPDRLEGTLAYISPEQTGRMNRAVDYRADFYSLGITLFELLTGKLPFAAEDAMEIVHSHIARNPPAPAISRHGQPVPKTIQDIILKLCAKNAEDRYRGVPGLLSDLRDCQSMLGGKWEDFQVGRRDFSDAFALPQKLYGRDKERDLLLGSFDRACQGGTIFAMVSGKSGSGKTALIQEILRPMTEHRGYFTSGKFDAHKRDVPYSAFISAFQDIIRQILTESSDRLKMWRDQIVAAFGPNGQVLLDVIPELQLIVGDQGPVPDLAPTEARNRFHIVFQNFVRTFTKPDHPLTIFLDDWQWADAGSLSMLKVLLSDPDAGHLLLVGSYRDNEVTDAHPLAIALEDLGKNNIRPVDLRLQLLGPKDVRSLVTDALCLPPERASLAEDLADAVFKKTDGNPFYSGEFLKSLYQDGLIFFDTSSGSFSYDILKIRAQAITDDLVKILSENIKELSDSTVSLVKIAACLGSQFDVRTLSMAADRPIAQCADEIEEAMMAGLMVALDDSYKYAASESNDPNFNVHYRFIHDQVHSAAYSLLNVAELRTTHLGIGRKLLATLPFDRRDERILEIVHHLNAGREDILDPAERVQLVEFNLQAGIKAKNSSAYDEAIRLFGVSNDAMPADADVSHYELFINVNRELGEAFYVVGENRHAEKHFARILAKAKTALEKVRIYELKIAMHAGRGDRGEAIRLGLEVLALLDVKLPRQPSESYFRSQMSSAEKALKGKSIERLVDTHLMQDPSKLAAMRILMQIATPARGLEGYLFGSIIANMILLSAKHGTAPATAFGFASYGMLLCAEMDKQESGYRFGRLALDLVEKLQARDLKCRVYFVYGSAIHHWKHPSQESSEYLLQAYQAGLETGDLEYVAATIFHLVASGLITGSTTLNQTLAEMDRFGNALYRTGQKYTMQLVALSRQYISNLQGGSRNRTRLSGERFQEDEAQAAWKEAANSEGLFYLNFYKTLLGSLFTQNDASIEFASKAGHHSSVMQGSIALPFLEFHEAVSCAALYPAAKSKDQAKLRANFEELRKRITLRAKASPENFAHHQLAVEGEQARINHKHGDAIELFDKAIEAATRNAYHLDSAFINELAGRYYLQLNQRKFALIYLREARRIYAEMDVTARVEDLLSHFPELSKRSDAPDTQIRVTMPQTQTRSVTDTSGSTFMGTTTSESTSAALDLTTVIKAAATLSGEIQLTKLLDRLLRIVLENAGAQRGHLILERDSNLIVSASGNLQEDKFEVLPNISLEGYDGLPASIVNYAARTRTSVVLDDATKEGKFKEDPYVKEKRPRSVLCMPVMLQGKLSAILYLENNAAAGVFNPTRLETLSVLSAQIGTSLENAQLYENLEKALALEKEARRAQVEINEVIQRFVPNEFLRLLGKDNIVAVKLGDNTAKQLTILFSDIRSFTTISEQLTPEENFKFINSYLRQVGPVVRENHGFIDKYIGDAIMALFEGPDNAMAASIRMFRVLEEWNEGRRRANFPVIKTGIGLHSGDLMLGTIGETNRMEGTVISDNVNLASRIEGLTKIYGSAMLISNATYSQLKEKEKYNYRTLDRVQVKGKKEPVTVIEVLDAEHSTIRDLKLNTRDQFEAAVKIYLSKQFKEAASAFESVLRINSTDRASGIYLKRCRIYSEKGVPENWDGVEKMTSK